MLFKDVLAFFDYEYTGRQKMMSKIWEKPRLALSFNECNPQAAGQDGWARGRAAAGIEQAWVLTSIISDSFKVHIF